jgi:hypothetical protein
MLRQGPMSCVLTHVLQKPVTLSPATSAAVISDLSALGATLEKYGWSFRAGHHGAYSSSACCSAGSSSSLVMLSCPSVRIEGIERHCDSEDDLLSFMRQQLELPQVRHSDGAAMYPECVHRELVSRSCRGAVMFNDVLSVAQCAALVAHLASRSLQYHVCSHGRPSVALLGSMPKASGYRPLIVSPHRAATAMGLNCFSPSTY